MTTKASLKPTRKAVNDNIEANLNPWNTKGTTREIVLLTGPELTRLYEASGFMTKPAALRMRNQSIVILLWRGALRVSELVNLSPRDIDLTRGTITVRRGKGGKRRVIGLDAYCMGVVAGWMEVREHTLRQHKGKGPLICDKYGDPLTRQAVAAILSRAAKRAHIDKDVYPHLLRHCCAAELVRENIPVVHIQRHLGHANLSATAVYLAGLMPQETIDKMQQRGFRPATLDALSQG